MLLFTPADNNNSETWFITHTTTHLLSFTKLFWAALNNIYELDIVVSVSSQCVFRWQSDIVCIICRYQYHHHPTNWVISHLSALVSQAKYFITDERKLFEWKYRVSSHWVSYESFKHQRSKVDHSTTGWGKEFLKNFHIE